MIPARRSKTNSHCHPERSEGPMYWPAAPMPHRSFASLRMTALKCGLHLRPQLSPRILRIELREFTKKLFGPLVPRHGHGDRHFDNFVTARALPRGRGYTLFAQAQFLTTLRSRGNLQQGSTVNRRDFNLRAQRSF